MRKILLTFIFLSLNIFANDGAYTLSGNQLIPIQESKISIKKEVLSITRLEDGNLDVKVEYTFFNPHKNKEVLVGFEAAEPEGDVQAESINGEHPYMKNFTVFMNGKKLSYKIREGIKGSEWGYLYYFKAKFKKGINYVTHHYRYEPSSSTGMYYAIDYILSAASRWKNGIIEDFTLIINVGEYERFAIEKTFFKKASEWNFDGSSVEVPSDIDFKKGAIRFYINRGSLVFKKKNFRPTEELNLLALRWTDKMPFYMENFNYKKNKLAFKIDGMYLENIVPKDKMSYKIFKNLPYARRGYVFKNSVIQQYYESLEWYKKNPNYKASRGDWTKSEREIDERVNEISLNILRNLSYAKRGYVFKGHLLKSYFESQKYYKKDPKYKAHFSSLPLVEQRWITKIKALKKSDNMDFYVLLDEFEKLYDGCLHKSDKKEIEKFVLELSQDLKRNDKKAISLKTTAKVFNFHFNRIKTNDMFFGILDEFKELKNYSEKENTEDETYSTYFQKKDDGCYEYWYRHDVHPKNYSEGESTIFISIGKENGKMKVVRVEMAG